MRTENIQWNFLNTDSAGIDGTSYRHTANVRIMNEEDFFGQSSCDMCNKVVLLWMVVCTSHFQPNEMDGKFIYRTFGIDTLFGVWYQ